VSNNELLVSIGSSCNVCHESDPRRAAVYVADLDGKNFRPFATGLRNTVFLATRPADGKIWGTEMGRDFLGDDLPPDEINIIESGKNYGWPTCYGQNIHDTDFDKNTYIRNPCQAPFETPSVIDIPAHHAPLGLAFTENGNVLYVSYHGSWNRSSPVGYKVVKYQLDSDGKLVSVADFMTGFLQPDGAIIGRPVGILAVSDNEIYLTDDRAGVVYLITNHQ
jgi:glucose/arabinose dehydrogenase